MSLLINFAAGAIGFLLGIGATVFYMRWKMMSQIGQIEEQMDSMMDMSDEMSELTEPDQSE